MITKRHMPGVWDNGYNHLMDTRYEVRDAQEVFEALADQAGDGATGGDQPDQLKAKSD